MSLPEEGTSPIRRMSHVRWIMLVYFLSGACSLIDEVVWVRLLKLTLGNTVYASSIVVSMFMGGLALGALIMGRYSDRVQRHLRLYALLETLVTLSALSIPFALKQADSFYTWFFQSFSPSNLQLLGLQVLISAGILLVPSMLMGSTLPLLGRFVTSLEEETGHLVGKLYSLNTLGAAAGCFLAGFFLIHTLGIMGTLYVAAGLNMIVAASGWILSRAEPITIDATQAAPVSAAPPVESPRQRDGRFFVLVLAFFLSGLISISYELLWMRSIIHLLGGATYVFSAVLTVYLIGNVIGAGIGSRLARRLKNPTAAFAVTLAMLGCYGVLYLPLLTKWSTGVFASINGRMGNMHAADGGWSVLVLPMVHSLFLFLVPATIMGIGFPIALQAWASHVHQVGRSTGSAYGVNTIGAVFGGILTGFILIPSLGLQLSITALGLIGLWFAVLTWSVVEQHPKKVGVLALLITAAILALVTDTFNVILAGSLLLTLIASTLLIAWTVAAVFFEPVRQLALVASAALVTLSVILTPSDLFNSVVAEGSFIPSGTHLLDVREGVTTTVSVHQFYAGGQLVLYSSGQSLAGDHYTARCDQKMLGNFAVLLSPHTQVVLSIGFGSGETTACLSRHDLKRVDCVEIAPEVPQMSLKYFSHLNLGDKHFDRVNMIYMDAKNYLHLTDNRYDAIINDSIHPSLFAENASLYSKEYYENARDRLNETGLFVSWIPTYDISYADLKSIIGTATEVFPYLTMWHLNFEGNDLEYVWIVGSKQPQEFSPRYIESVLDKPIIQKTMSEIGIRNSIDLLKCYVGDKKDLEPVLQGYHVNSDNFPFVEFATDPRTPSDQIHQDLVANVRSDSVYSHIDWTGFTAEEKKAWLTQFEPVFSAGKSARK